MHELAAMALNSAGRKRLKRGEGFVSGGKRNYSAYPRPSSATDFPVASWRPKTAAGTARSTTMPDILAGTLLIQE